MKIFKDLAKAKKQFHNTELKKTGYNKFVGYKYFELADFIKPIVEILEENNLVSFVSFGSELATLKVVQVEDQSKIVITSPMSSANLKGCHDVQNLGAVQTYLRRYLYTALFDIIENDILDGSEPKTTEKRKYFCEKCKKEITKTQAGTSLKEKGTRLCSNCIIDHSKTIQNILKEHKLDKYFMPCLNYLKNQKTGNNNESFFEYGVKNGSWENLIIRFLQFEIGKINKEYLSSFGKTATLKDYSEGLIILEEEK